MVQIKRTPPDVMVDRWATWRRSRKRKIAKAARRPRAVNTENAATLQDTRERVFRGRKYRVPPISFRLGVRVFEHLERLDAIQAADQPAWSQLLDWHTEAARLAKRACRPRSHLRRLFWRLPLNPFRKGTLQEVADLLGFISAWAMMDHALTPTTTANGGPPGTSRATSRGS
ncbi:MAG: hypothetical protein ACOC92_02070 [bacterium]